MKKIKRRQEDILFSRYIRTRDNWTCQRCLKRFPEKSASLQCSHFHGRRKWSTRFDPDNAYSACVGCHRYLEENPLEHVEFMKKRLGDKFNALTVRANTPMKKDRKLMLLYVNALIKQKEKS